MNEEQKFEDYRNRLNIRDVLTDAGYTLHKRDGLRYPAYVRLDNDGRRIRGDKFIVMPNKNCCFQPPTIKLYSVTSASEQFAAVTVILFSFTDAETEIIGAFLPSDIFSFCV